MNKARILLVDNDADYLRTKTEWLERHGYDVLTAMGVREALVRLKDTQVHLAIVNYRLTDDRDEKDNSGLDVLRKMDLFTPKLVTTQLEEPALFEAAREILSPFNGIAMAQDVLRKKDEQRLLAQIDKLISQRYNLQLEINDSESIGKMLRLCRTLGIYDIRETNSLFQSLLCSRRDCGAITVTRIRSIKDQSRVARLRMQIASEGRIEYFSVLWGTPRELQIVEASSPRPSHRGYTLHLAAVAYPGSLWDRILDRLPWLEKVAKPLWEIIKLALKFVPIT